MSNMSSFLLFFYVLLFTTPLKLYSSSPTFESHFTKPLRRLPPPESSNSTYQQYFELRRPLPFDDLAPSCTYLALRHNFSDTIGKPPISVPYSPPPNCTNWTHVALDFRVAVKGDQYDRIAAVWLDGAELLRTSTAEPTEDGIFWNVRKDVTRYISILSKSNISLTVMLENIVNDVYTGVYHVSVSFMYYQASAVTVPVLNNLKINRKLGADNDRQKLGIVKYKGTRTYNVYEKPADLIIPISGIEEEGFWFRIENQNDVHYKKFQIPPNTYKAVIEIYVSFHGNDEFWYSNPPNSYIEFNKLCTGRGNGAYREVLVTVDGNLVGSVLPFPVIFTGGINPLFWEPVVGIGAFDLPSYDIDLTPFLGMLLDGKNHTIGLGVGDGISFWLVDANLHLWVDNGMTEVQAEVLDYSYPALTMERKYKFKLLDGKFKVEAERKSHFVGWVNSTVGNFTTHVSHEFKFKNSVKFKNNGTDKVVEHKVMTTIEVKVKSDQDVLISHATVKREFPLNIEISILPGSENDTDLMITTVAHEFQEKNGLKEKSSNGDYSSILHNKQNSAGWMEVKDHDVLSGEGKTNQFYTYEDEFGCFSQVSKAENGTLVSESSSFSCASLY